MNLLFTTPTFYPFRGGAESCIEDLATRFVEDGHNVTVATALYSPALSSCENQNGISIRRLKYPLEGHGPARKLWRLICSLVALLRVVRNAKVDVVCVGLVGVDSFLILLLHYVLNFRLILCLHGDELRTYVKVSPLIRWTLRRCLRRCYAAIAVSEQLKAETLLFAPAAREKVVVIPNGVDGKRIKHEPAYRHERDYVLFVGRLHPVKGLETLIEAFAQVTKEAPELDLLIAGSGPLETQLKEVVSQRDLSDRISFLGDRARSDIYALINGCQLLVLPSLSEGCPIVLLEARAAGKVAIASDVEGTAEIIQHETNGLLFTSGKAAELAALIIKYHRDNERRTRLEAKIGNIDLGCYDIEKTFVTHRDLYRGLFPALKICLISQFYNQDPDCSGPSTYYFNLVEALARLGHDVYLITSSSATGSCPANVLSTSQRSSVGGSAVSGSGAGFLRVWDRLAFSLRAYGKVRVLERSTRVDVFIAPELFAPALVLSVVKRRKLITRLHTPTYVVDKFNAPHRSTAIGTILSVPERIQAKRSHGLSVASTQLKSVISRDWKIPRDRIQLIPNSINVAGIRQLAAQQEREISGDYLLYFGRLEVRKGVHILSQALRQVLPTRPDLKVVFIGQDWGLKETIQRENVAHQERLIFTGPCDRARLFGAICFSRLVVLPSLFENLSLAGLEAMALGKSIIGTYTTAFEDIIEDNVNGFLVEPGNAEALAEKILWCLESGRLDDIGQHAYESVLRFDSLLIAQQKVEFYRSVISGP